MHKTLANNASSGSVDRFLCLAMSLVLMGLSEAVPILGSNSSASTSSSTDSTFTTSTNTTQSTYTTETSITTTTTSYDFDKVKRQAILIWTGFTLFFVCLCGVAVGCGRLGYGGSGEVGIPGGCARISASTGQRVGT